MPAVLEPPEVRREPLVSPDRIRPGGRKRQYSDKSVSGFIGKSVSGFTFRGEYHEIHKWNSLLVTLSEILYEAHTTEFPKMFDLGGYRRRYFTHDSTQLGQPHQVDDSGIYVKTKFDNNKTVQRCYELLRLFGYDRTDLRIEYR